MTPRSFSTVSWPSFRASKPRPCCGKRRRPCDRAGRLLVELLDQNRVDKHNSTWWYTDDSGLWGDRPFLHLGERFWDETARTSLERFHVLDLETAELAEVILCDQTYAVDEMIQSCGGGLCRCGSRLGLVWGLPGMGGVL